LSAASSTVRARREGGFTLVEMLISLTIVIFALGLASQLLMETAVLFQGSAREARSTPVPQAIARIRADVIASAFCIVTTLPDGTMDRLVLSGHPAGNVAYQLVGTNLYRIQNSVDATDGDILWQGVDSWMASTIPVGGRLLHVEIHYRQGKGPQFLARTPGRQGPGEIPRVQSLYALPRGAGMGTGW
jgi:prepilin-type N-terminal cleavage/methylation domain-containing protein